MDRFDLAFHTDAGAFYARVRAIILSGDELLMVRHRKGYFYPVGGKIHQNETSFDAVIREVYEETGITMEPERIGFIHENLYKKGDVPHHEIVIYFYMHTPENLREKLLAGVERDELVWLPLSQISDMKNLFPTFFKTRLLAPVDHPVHLFTWENWQSGEE